jgi:hypothetical protein
MAVKDRAKNVEAKHRRPAGADIGLCTRDYHACEIEEIIIERGLRAMLLTRYISYIGPCGNPRVLKGNVFEKKDV